MKVLVPPLCQKAGDNKSSILSVRGSELLRSRFLVENEKDVKEVYEAWAETYETDSFSSLQFDSPEQCARSVLAHWPKKAHGAGSKDMSISDRVQVLDVGCGTGATGRLLIELSNKITAPAVTKDATMFGFDLSPSMLEIAKGEKVYDGGLCCHSVTSYPWPYKNDSMDIVMCNGVLIYVKDPKCMDEFVRVAKPGGHIVLMIRVDGLHVFQQKLKDLANQHIWSLCYVSETRNNFPSARNVDDIGAEALEDVLYNLYVFRKESSR